MFLDTESKRPKRQRGTRLTPRDLFVLRWIGEQYAIRFDQLQRLLAVHSTEPERLRQEGVLSEARTRRTIRRWEREDLVQYKLFLVHECGWVWLTRKGLQTLEMEVRYYDPRLASLEHLYYINQARLFVTERRQEDEWIAERLLRAQQDQRSKGDTVDHLPDGVLVKPDRTRIAIEVELHAKSRVRLVAILSSLQEHYYRTWYFATEPVATLLREVVQSSLSESQRRTIQILSLEERLL